MRPETFWAWVALIGVFLLAFLSLAAVWFMAGEPRACECLRTYDVSAQ